MGFDLRGLEIHSSRMWRWASVRRALGLMEKVGLNALIFHQNDLIDQLVLPRSAFSEELMWERWPVRMHIVDGNRHYVQRVIRECHRRGIRFFAEVKEIWYPEGFLELFPELVGANGAVCPTNPLWWTFIEEKVTELFDLVPDLDGIIVSPASRESRASIAANSCLCDRCATISPVDWYSQLIAALHGPTSSRGKTLVVRDFSYTAAEQSLAIDAASRVSGDIVMALKNTPHDYYPTFPSNPRIGNTGSQPSWVEFDTWGQFFGLGFFPCSVVEDMQQRLRHCAEHGVTGVWFRTDWEGMIEASSFSSFNILNVIAGGLLATNQDLNLDDVYKSWCEYGLFYPLRPESCQGDPVAVGGGAYRILRDFMRASWSVLEKTLFVRGHVFQEDGMFPSTLARAFDMMTRIHGRDDWEPGASSRIQPVAGNLVAILEEKDRALEEVRQITTKLDTEALEVPPELSAEIADMIDLYRVYVEGFSECCRACFLAQAAVEQDRSSAEHVRQAREAVDSLAAYREKLSRRLEGRSYPHIVSWLLDVHRLDSLIDDINERLGLS
jgi:hypothetical protein